MGVSGPRKEIGGDGRRHTDLDPDELIGPIRPWGPRWSPCEGSRNPDRAIVGFHPVLLSVEVVVSDLPVLKFSFSQVRLVRPRLGLLEADAPGQMALRLAPALGTGNVVRGYRRRGSCGNANRRRRVRRCLNWRGARPCEGSGSEARDLLPDDRARASRLAQAPNRSGERRCAGKGVASRVDATTGPAGDRRPSTSRSTLTAGPPAKSSSSERSEPEVRPRP